MTYLFRFLIVFSTMWMMDGCAVQPLALHPDSGMLEVGPQHHAMHIAESQSVMQPSVHVRQYILVDPETGADIVYEHAVANTGYEFGRSVTYTVDAIFGAKQCTVMSRQAGYVLLKVVFYDTTVLYAVAEEGIKRELKLVYAPEYETIRSVYRGLAHGEKALLFSKEAATGRGIIGFRTDWTYRMLFLKNILSREFDGFGMVK